MEIGVICKLTCESKYLANAIKDANDEIAVYGAEISILKELPVDQQRTVPIQFVWHDGCLYHEDSCRNMSIAIEENCTVEQIGAVLYVRGKQ